MLVRELMTPQPLSATPEMPMSAVIADMKRLGIRHVPVVDGGLPVAVLSDRDVTFLHGVLEIYQGMDPAFAGSILKLPVARLLELRLLVPRPVISVRESDAAREAIVRLIDHRVSALPVLSEDGQSLVGMLSYVDLLRHCAGHFDLGIAEGPA